MFQAALVLGRAPHWAQRRDSAMNLDEKQRHTEFRLRQWSCNLNFVSVGILKYIVQSF